LLIIAGSRDLAAMSFGMNLNFFIKVFYEWNNSCCIWADALTQPTEN
jgi:hypothetical protein